MEDQPEKEQPEQAPAFLAGALLKIAKGNAPNDIDGRVFLIVEGKTEDICLEIREALVRKPECFVELLLTMRPWPRDIVTIDSKKLNQHTMIKDIIPFK